MYITINYDLICHTPCLGRTVFSAYFINFICEFHFLPYNIVNIVSFKCICNRNTQFYGSVLCYWTISSYFWGIPSNFLVFFKFNCWYIVLSSLESYFIIYCYMCVCYRARTYKKIREIYLWFVDIWHILLFFSPFFSRVT